MAVKKISELTTFTGAVEADDYLPIVDTSATETKKIAATLFKGDQGVPGNVPKLEVVDIDDPSAELSVLGAGLINSDLVQVWQDTGTANNPTTKYIYDEDTTETEDIPFIIDGVEGKFIASSAGRYNDSMITFKENIDTKGQAWSNANTLTDAATIATNCNNGNVHTVTLEGNRTLGAPTNLKNGATYVWIIKQDGTGTRTLAYNAVFKFEAGAAPILSIGINDVDILSGVSDGTNVYAQLTKDFS